MEKSNNICHINLDIDVYSVVIEFMELKDIIYSMMSLSRNVR
jgi:hypothetical protein